MKNFLLGITGKWWVAGLIGAGLLLWAAYAAYQAKTGGAVQPAAELAKISGKVEKASQVTVERRGRRGGSRGTDRYYELEVNTGKAAEKVRVGYLVNQEVVRFIVQENISAQVDADDNNIAYAVSVGGKDVIRYADTAKVMQAKAESSAATATSSGMLGFGLLMLALGAGGFFLNRKLLESLRAEQQQAGVTPS